MRVPTGVRPQDFYLQPAACRWASGPPPPLSSSLTSSSHAHAFTPTGARGRANTHTPTVSPLSSGARGAVFGFDHLFESPDRCRCSSRALSCLSPLCPLLSAGMSSASLKCTFIVNCGVIQARTHTHTPSLWPLKAHFTLLERTEAVTVAFCFMLMQDVWIHNLTNQWRLPAEPTGPQNYRCWNIMQLVQKKNKPCFHLFLSDKTLVFTASTHNRALFNLQFTVFLGHGRRDLMELTEWLLRETFDGHFKPHIH